MAAFDQYGIGAELQELLRLLKHLALVARHGHVEQRRRFRKVGRHDIRVCEEFTQSVERVGA